MGKTAKKRLNNKYKEFKQLVDYFAGYPVNADFDYSSLYQFFDLPLNNVGDAAAASNYQLNTHEFEVEVIRFIAKMYGKEQDYWGYITNGGSEGNLCGLHVARNRYPDGIVYHSEHSHYSVPKAVEITRSESECLPVLANGEIDYDAFSQALANHPDRPAIVMLNLGTTMTGAIDNIKKIKAILAENNIEQYYLHCDGALHGLILPFCQQDQPIKFDDFDSISISGHKFIGSPLPCGLFLTHQHIIDGQKRYIEYVKANDCTLSGSRNAITPLILWYAIYENGEEKLTLLTQQCLAVTQYAIDSMQAAGIEAWANDCSPIVVFPKPGDAVINKWSLAPYRDIAHLVTVGHVTKELIDDIIIDIVKDRNGETIEPHSGNKHQGPVNKKTLTWLGVTGAILGVVGTVSMT